MERDHCEEAAVALPASRNADLAKCAQHYRASETNRAVAMNQSFLRMFVGYCAQEPMAVEKRSGDHVSSYHHRLNLIHIDIVHIVPEDETPNMDRAADREHNDRAVSPSAFELDVLMLDIAPGTPSDVR